MKKDKIRIMIVDDHELVRKTWKLLLQQQERFDVIAECANGSEAIGQVQTTKPDIILMDINMSPINGFEATRKIVAHHPDIRIIGVSINNQVAYARNMMQLGARGFVTKNATPDEMVKAITEVADGRTYICEEIRVKMKPEENNS